MNKKYFNDGQMQVMYIGANETYVIASRRFGKSDGLIAPHIIRLVQSMPGGTFAIVGSTYKQLLTRTLPATLAALQRLGYLQNVHYYIGRRPPKTANFGQPKFNLQDFSHAMTWYNGSVFHLISQDTAFSSNSLTLDGVVIDEARTINKDKFENETVPALGGYPYFSHVPWHRGIFCVSDMPQSKSAMWLVLKEKQMDKELIDTIGALIHEYWTYKKAYTENPTYYYKNKKDDALSTLNLFRKKAILYKEFSAIDNIQILGEDYIAKMKRNLPALIFRTSILNERHFKIENGFYAALSEEKHYYISYDNSYIDKQRLKGNEYNFSQIKNALCLQDADIDKSLPLSIALDYNSNINWIVAGQPDYNKNTIRIVSSMFVKTPDKIRELVQKFCDYYSPLPIKQVNFYYDHTALQGAYAVSDDNFASVVKDEFEKRNWVVVAVYIGQAPSHANKHLYIDQALKGQRYLMPLFNRDNNEFLLPALENTGIKIGRKGFEKDKSQEKLADTEDDPSELRTDGTDAFDTLFIGLNLFPAYNTITSLSNATYFG